MPCEVESFEVTFLTQTDKAVLVEHEGEEFWIPNTQIDDDSEVFVGCDLQRGEEGTLVCTTWIAEQKGLR